MKRVFLLSRRRFPVITRIVLLLTLASGLGLRLKASTIEYVVADLGADLYRYTYTLKSFDLMIDQELAIRFEVGLYGSLSNGIAGSDFGLALFQPNNPPGASGIYSALALVNHPSLAGPFGVDVVFRGAGRPGAQQYFVYQFDDSGESIIDFGVTTLAGTAVPEPAPWMLAVSGTLVCTACATLRRRRGRARIPLS